jgi:hypothetical protein
MLFSLSTEDFCSCNHCPSVSKQLIRPRLEARSMKPHASLVMFIIIDPKKMFLFVNSESHQHSTCTFPSIHSSIYWAEFSKQKPESNTGLTPQRSKSLNNEEVLRIQELPVINSRFSSPRYQPSFVSISWAVVLFCVKYSIASADAQSRAVICNRCFAAHRCSAKAI